MQGTALSGGAKRKATILIKVPIFKGDTSSIDLWIRSSHLELKDRIWSGGALRNQGLTDRGGVGRTKTRWIPRLMGGASGQGEY